MKLVDRKFSARPKAYLERFNRTLPLRNRLDVLLVALIALTVLLLAVGVAWYHHIRLDAGAFDDPLVAPLTDDRILENVRDGLPGEMFLDAVIDAASDKVILSQQGGRIHTYDPLTHLWITETPFTSDDPVASEFVALRSGCETGQIVGTRGHCDDPGGFWALGNDGSLARRENDEWRIVLANTRFADTTGAYVEHDELVAASVSSDETWLLFGTDDGSLGLYSTQEHRWYQVDLSAPLSVISSIRYWRNNFLIATEGGLYSLRPQDEASPAVERTTYTGEILDIAVDEEDALWVLELVECQNDVADCNKLTRLDSDLGQRPEIILDQQNRYVDLDFSGLQYAQQIGQQLWLVGTKGVYTYDLTLRQWDQITASPITITLQQRDSAGFYYVDGNSITLVTENGRRSLIAASPNGTKITQILLKTDNTLYVLTDHHEVYYVDVAAQSSSSVYSPQWTSVNPDTLSTAYYIADSLVLVGTDGIVLHNPVERTYADVLRDAMPAWVTDKNTAWIPVNDGVFAVAHDGFTDNIYAIPASAYESTSALSELLQDLTPVPFASPTKVWAWESGLGVIDGLGMTSRLALDLELNPLIGDPALSLSNAKIQDVQQIGDQFVVITDQEIYRYDLRTRSWSAPTRPTLEDGITMVEILAHSDQLLIRTSDDKLRQEDGQPLIGGGDQFRVTDQSLSDVFKIEEQLLFAGNGVIDAYDLQLRSIKNLYTLQGTDAVSILGNTGDSIVSTTGNTVYRNDTAIEPAQHPVVNATLAGQRLLTVRLDGNEPYLALYQTDDWSPSCLFRQAYAEGAGTVLDARSLYDAVTAVLTDNGLYLYNLHYRSWISTDVGVNADRIYSVAGWLVIADTVQDDETTLQMIRVTDIPQPDSCSDQPVTIAVTDTINVTSYTVNESLDKLAYVDRDGAVWQWQNGQITQVLASNLNTPQVLTQVFDQIDDDYLLFEAESGLWEYHLSLKTWTSISVVSSQALSEGRDFNAVPSPDGTYSITLNTDDRIYFGQLRPGQSSLPLETLWDGQESHLGRSAAGFIAAYMAPPTHWIFLFDNGLHYFNAATREWVGATPLTVDSTYRLYDLHGRKTLMSDSSPTWFIATSRDAFPVSFARYDSEASDIEVVLDTDGHIWRLTAASEVQKCSAQTGTYTCQVIKSPFSVNPQNVLATYDFNNDVIFEFSDGLRRYNSGLAIEDALANAEGFTNVASAFAPSDNSYLLYSDVNNELLIIHSDWTVDRYNDIQDLVRDDRNAVWAKRTDGWWLFIPQNDRFEPVGVDDTGTKTYLRWNASATRRLDEDTLAYYDGEWKTTEHPIATSIPLAQEIEDILHGPGDSWWIVYNGQFTVIAPDQCVSPELLVPMHIQQVTEVARATETAVFDATRIGDVTATAAMQAAQTQAIVSTLTAEAELTQGAETAVALASQTAEAIGMTEVVQLLTATAGAMATATPEITPFVYDFIPWMPPAAATDVIAQFPTFTLTATSTSTLTATPTLTPSVTSTDTATPTITPTFTITPSFTPTVTLTPTPEPINCYSVTHSGTLPFPGPIISADFSSNSSVTLIDATGSAFNIRLIEDGTAAIEVSDAENLLPRLERQDSWDIYRSTIETVPSGLEVFRPARSFTDLANELSVNYGNGVVPLTGSSASYQTSRIATQFLNSGWISWDADQNSFSVATIDGVRSLSPDEMIVDERFIFEPVSAAISIDGRFDVANPYGFWRFSNNRLELTDNTILFQPEAIGLPIRTYRDSFLIGDITYNRTRSRYVIGATDSVEFDIGVVHFTDLPETNEISVTVQIDGRPVNAWTRNGFLWDIDRGELAYQGDRLLMNSAAGVHDSQGYDEFALHPENVPPSARGLRGGTNGDVYFETAGRWYQYEQNGEWVIVSDPIANRDLLTNNQWAWRLEDYRLHVAITEQLGAFALLPEKVGFTSDQLVSAAVYNDLMYVSTEAFLERYNVSQLFVPTFRPITAPQNGQFFSVRNHTGLNELYLDAAATIVQWDEAAQGFVTSTTDPRQNRAMLTTDWLDFDVIDGVIVKRLRGDAILSSSLVLSINQGRLTSDIITGMDLDNEATVLASASGLQFYLDKNFSYSALNKVVDISEGPDDVVRTLGHNTDDPQLLMAATLTECIYIAQGAPQELACNEQDTFSRLRVVTPMWQWTKSPDGIVVGQYFDSKASEWSTEYIEIRTGRLPHDYLADALYCDGKWATLWNNRVFVSITSSTDIRNASHFGFPSLPIAEIMCVSAQIDSDLSDLVGLYLVDQEQHGFRFEVDHWQKVPVSVMSNVLDRRAESVIYRSGNLRGTSPANSRPMIAQQDSEGNWRRLAWLPRSASGPWNLAADNWHALTYVQNKLWAQTPEGWISVATDGEERARWMTEDLTVVRELLPNSQGCTVTDILNSIDEIFVRCGRDSSHVYRGSLSAGVDESVFEVADVDPFAHVSLVTYEGLNLELIDNTGERFGSLRGELHGNSVELSSGTFAHDNIRQIEPYKGRLLSLTSAQTLWLMPRLQHPIIALYALNDTHLWGTVASIVTGLQNDNMGICVTHTNGTFGYLVDEHIEISYEQPCAEFVGHEGLWLYFRIADQVRIAGLDDVADGMMRWLEEGRFADDVAIGLPISARSDETILHYIPQRNGVIVYDASLRQLRAFPGSEGTIGDELPPHVLTTIDGRNIVYPDGLNLRPLAASETTYPAPYLPANSSNVISLTPQTADLDAPRIRMHTDGGWRWRYGDKTPNTFEIAPTLRTLLDAPLEVVWSEDAIMFSSLDEMKCQIDVAAVDGNLVELIQTDHRLILVTTTDLLQIELEKVGGSLAEPGLQYIACAR